MTTKLILFIIFFILFIRLINGVFKFIYRGLGHNPSSSKFDHRNNRYKKKGDVNIDHVPNENNKGQNKGYGGGEYIDYEEIK